MVEPSVWRSRPAPAEWVLYEGAADLRAVGEVFVQQSLCPARRLAARMSASQNGRTCDETQRRRPLDPTRAHREGSTVNPVDRSEPRGDMPAGDGNQTGRWANVTMANMRRWVCDRA